MTICAFWPVPITVLPYGLTCALHQNEQDLVDLKEFAEAHGCAVEWAREDEIRASLDASAENPESEASQDQNV